MKLRAQFPQLGAARPASGSTAGRSVTRRAFWPTSRNPELPAAPGSETCEPAPALPTRPAPIMTREFAPPLDWPSTVAAWRSTTGKAGEAP